MKLKDSRPICKPGDHSICEAGFMAMSYDRVSKEDSKRGITKETCLPCRKIIRERNKLQPQPQPSLSR
jgi:hypothetical protein